MHAGLDAGQRASPCLPGECVTVQFVYALVRLVEYIGHFWINLRLATKQQILLARAARTAKLELVRVAQAQPEYSCDRR